MKKAFTKTIIDSLFCVIALSLVFLLYTHSLILAILLFALSAVMIARHKSKKLLKIFIWIGLFGTICDIAGTHAGAWAYLQSDFLGITFWSPVLWGIAGTYIAIVSKELE